jgi:hypothetical protein
MVQPEEIDRRRRRRRTWMLCAAMSVALLAAGCSRGGAGTSGGASTGNAESLALGAGPLPSLSPRTDASGAPACSLPPRVATPDWIPTNLPWPPGSYVSRTFGTGAQRAEVIVPVSQQEFARFIHDRWPSAGFRLGEGDAEPGKEMDQEFRGSSGEGDLKARVVLCNPGYQLVFFSFTSS